MGIPSYQCPEELLHLWQNPLELLGYTVHLVRREEVPVTDLPDAVHIHSTWDVSSRENKASIRNVRMEPPIGDWEWTNRILIVNCSLSRGSWELAQDIERVLFASGAKGAGMRSCRCIYRCSLKLLEEMLEHCRIDHIEMQATHADPGVSPTDKPYFTMVAKRANASVQIYTGPGIDVKTSEFLHFVALDYQRSLSFCTRRENKRLMRDIAALLEKRDAVKCTTKPVHTEDL